ncbi:MAG: O-antigen ligase family protein [Gemmataceae bacterium]
MRSSPALHLLTLHLAVSPLLFCRGTSDVFELAKVSWLILTAILLTVMAVTHRVSWPRGGRLTAWGIGLFVASASASTAGSLSWRQSLLGTTDNRLGLIAIIALAILFFATRAIARTASDRRLLLTAVPIAGGVAGLYAVLQALGLDPFAWADVSQIAGFGRPGSTLGHPNLLAAYLAVALPMTLAFAREHLPTDRRRAALFGGVALVELAAIVLSLSRAGWLAVAVSTVVLLAGWRPPRKWILAGGLVVAAGALIAGAAGIERVRHLADPSGRLHMWTAATRIFLDRPWLGCGPEAFQFAFPEHRTPAFWAVEWGTTPARAHNEPLHLLATQGLFGLAAALVVIYGLVRDGRDAWRRCSPGERIWQSALFAALAAFATQAQFGYSTLGIATLAVSLAGVLHVPANAESRPIGIRSPLRWFVWLPAVLLAYRLAWLPLAASSACRDGDELLADNPSAAMAAFERATELEPACDTYWSRRGAAALAAGRPAQAHDCFATAARLIPVNAFHHHNLAQALADLRPSEAFAEFDASLRLDPNNVEFALDAARFALQQRDALRASGYIEMALASFPDYAALRAESAYLALLESRPAEAFARLDAALAADWRGDGEARQRAAAVRAEVLRRIVAQNRNVNDAIASTPNGRGPTTGKPAATPSSERGNWK